MFQDDERSQLMAVRATNARRGAATLGMMLGRILSRELTHTETPFDMEIVAELTRSARYLPPDLQEIILNIAAQVQLDAIAEFMKRE